MKGENWKLVEIYRNSKLRLFCKKSIKISPRKENKNYSSYKIMDSNEEIILLNIIHLTSAMYKDEESRNERARTTSDELRKIEEEIFGDSEYKSIVMGDFNLQPYSRGISGIWGFNATMSIPKAKRKIRLIGGEKKFYYFNPTWHLMGRNQMIQGTYYLDSNQQDLSMFWYSFDEVLIRPCFIDKFNWDFFSIVERTKDFNFISNHKINKKDFSDHLPIKFEIIEEKE
mgnify:CR=1 FL=1